MPPRHDTATDRPTEPSLVVLTDADQYPAHPQRSWHHRAGWRIIEYDTCIDSVTENLVGLACEVIHNNRLWLGAIDLAVDGTARYFPFGHQPFADPTHFPPSTPPDTETATTHDSNHHPREPEHR